MKQKLLEKYPDMLSDSLSPIHMHTPDGHMHISMDKDATPHPPEAYRSDTSPRLIVLCKT